MIRSLDLFGPLLRFFVTLNRKLKSPTPERAKRFRSSLLIHPQHTHTPLTFTLLRLVPGHPERGDGQPRTEAERNEARWGKLPKDVGKGGREPAPRQYCGGILPFSGECDIAVPLLYSACLGPAMKRVMGLIDVFHQGNS